MAPEYAWWAQGWAGLQRDRGCSHGESARMLQVGQHEASQTVQVDLSAYDCLGDQDG